MNEQHDIIRKLSADVRDSVTARTVEVWTFIYNYVAENSYTDCADEAFFSQVHSRFDISSRTISGHLRRMQRAGLLQVWEGTIGAGQSSPYSSFLFGIPPSRIMRYTLPGRKPPTELYRRTEQA